MSDTHPQPSPSVLVLGARGRFGQATARAFAEAGWRVFAQVRPGTHDLPTPGPVSWLHRDPQDTEALARAAAGSTVVVNGLNPVYTHRAWREGVPRLTDAAIRAAEALGATLMQPANVYNFGAGMPRLLHEDTPQAATTVKGRLRIASEAQIRQATVEGRVRAVLIRAGDFYGSGHGSWLDLVIAKDLQRGRFTYPGPLDVPTAWAYLPDLATTFVRVAQARERLAPFECFHFSGDSLTGRQWQEALTALARERGWLGTDRTLRSSTLPWALVRAAGLVMPQMASISEMRYLWHTPHALANERLRALIGQEPHTPFASALRRAMADLHPVQTAALPRLTP